MFTQSDSPRGLDCPVCGYDLRGSMGNWSNACPLRGVCPECGLEFEWADMVGSSKRRLVRIADTMSDWFGLSASRTRRMLRRIRYRLGRRGASRTPR